MKIVLLGAGSTIFSKNVIGDCMLTKTLCKSEFALYDIDARRLNESASIVNAINDQYNNGRAKITTYLGVAKRKEALYGANFIINSIQVGGYKPCTVADFEIPKKYGLNQTIGDTLGIGGIMRTLRTLPIIDDFVNDINQVAADAWFLNYTNPMAMITGYMQRYTDIKTIGICHSVQTCSETLLKNLGMDDKISGRREVIAGINHMAWLLEIKDKDGIDLYPEIRKKAIEKNKTEKHDDMVRFEYINRLGFYCTESSEHNAEYNPYFIKSKYPELIDKYNIPIDEYLRRCVKQISDWESDYLNLKNNKAMEIERSNEYASHIIESIVTNKPYSIGGNVINKGLITNIDPKACVEVPCMVDGSGIHPCYVGQLPVQLAALNMSNVGTQLMTIEAYITKRREAIYQAAMLDPHCAAELSIDDIVDMCDDLIAAHGSYLDDYKWRC